MKFRFSIILFLLSFSSYSYSNPLTHDATPYELEYAKQINRSLYEYKKNIEPFKKTFPVNYVPVEDDADFSYVLISSAYNEHSEIQALRKSIASNLPNNVKLVVLTNTRDASEIFKIFSQWIDPSRLIIAADPSSNTINGFWARDSFPIPVKNKNTGDISLIGHRYFRPFNASFTIAKSVSASFVSRGEIFVGGNLLADREGNCFTVDSDRLFDMTGEDIQNVYGCKTIQVLTHESGIGDVDEVIKPIGNKIMLTTQPVYEPLLSSLGYKVVLLPQIKNSYRTHANSLIVGKTVFMPIFGIKEDEKAQKTYEDLGYKVVPIRTNYLSDFLKGSIHCQTMAYPSISKQELFSRLNLEEINF